MREQPMGPICLNSCCVPRGNRQKRIHLFFTKNAPNVVWAHVSPTDGDARMHTCRRLHDNCRENVYKLHDSVHECSDSVTMTKFGAKVLRIGETNQQYNVRFF